jgi:adenylosuccinate lyase
VRLQATEVEELREPAMAGHVGSSTMPQKRNPMTSEYLVGSARLLRAILGAVREGPAHAGERDMAPWAAEWIAVPSACILASGIADKLAWIAEGLEVRAADMARNLARTEGAIMAEAAMMRLGEELGHEAAHHLLREAAWRSDREGTTIGEALAAGDEPVPDDVLALLREPARYVGWSADVARAAAARARGVAG